MCIDEKFSILKYMLLHRNVQQHGVLSVLIRCTSYTVYSRRIRRIYSC